MSKGHPLSRSELKLLIHDLWSQGRWLQLATLDTFNTKLTALEKAYIALANCHIGEAEIAGQLLEELSTNRGIQNKLSHLLLASHNLNLSRGLQIIESGNNPSVIAGNKANRFSVQKINEIELGNAWAGNTVNTVIFRHHGMFSKNGWQYTAFYIDNSTLRIVKRNLESESYSYFDISGDYNIKDAHNSISLGMDNRGHIHISYDHHGTKLKYRKTLEPFDIESWSDELDMTGARESKVTYPCFLMSRESESLLVLYRDGNHQKGSAYIKEYDEIRECWHDSETAILSGDLNQPWTSNAYWNHPVRDSQGDLHLSFVWRTHHINNQHINNMNICYAKSSDNGKTWYSSNMKPFQLPITQVNAEVIWPISPASNLINQTSMAVDSKNQPHIVFYSNDHDGIVQYQHLFFDGKKWNHQFISKRTNAFDLCGGGTLQIPISRPEIVIDDNDNVFVIYRGDITENKLVASLLPSPHYTYNPLNEKIIYAESVGSAEPIIDRLRWQNEKILSILVQYNDQPNHDINHDNLSMPIYIVDFNFST